MDDQQAIRSMKKGDLSGLEVLVVRYQNKAIYTAFLITRNEQLAEDIVQETFLKIYRFIQHFDEKRPFEPYLLRSVMNAALNSLEREAHKQSFEDVQNLPYLERLMTQVSQTEDEVVYKQLKNEIYQALEKLSPRQRLVVVQRYYLEMSEKEMSESLSVSPGTIKWLLNNARQRLQHLLVSDRRAQ
ncbi:MAG: sigma-70 family RNA polymerase sigma factor [Anaerolineae bacterium]|nr:sigma-70 family RNA polymerase sigma factor [Anaerolineae bacterium]